MEDLYGVATSVSNSLPSSHPRWLMHLGQIWHRNAKICTREKGKRNNSAMRHNAWTLQSHPTNQQIPV
jgi:hypothetical protein